MKVMMVLISLVLAGINLQPERLQPQDEERTKELARALELSAQTVRLYSEKRYSEALPLALQVVEIRQRLLPPDDALLGAALSNLGFLYVATKKDGEAEKTFQRALLVYESHSEKSDSVVSSILRGLAYIYVRKHDYERADPLFLRSLEIQEKQLGPTNSKTVETMKDYACINLWAHTGKSERNQASDPSKELKGRAMCWLAGFEDNCTKDDKVKPDDILNGKAIKLTAPSYPPEARQKRLTGRVFAAVLIDEAGNVINARAVCGGYPELNQVGVEAARSSKFSPTLVNQKAVRVTGVIVYNFIAQ
jgi:TonB family protein